MHEVLHLDTWKGIVVETKMRELDTLLARLHRHENKKSREARLLIQQAWERVFWLEKYHQTHYPVIQRLLEYKKAPQITAEPPYD